MTFVQKDRDYRSIIGIVIFVCAVMIFVESVLQPAYVVKSAVKLVLFLGSFFLCSRMFHCRVLTKNYHRNALKRIILLAVGVYLFTFAGYHLLQDFLDIEQIRQSLMGKEGIDAGNFIFVALYISIVNSFIEELFFRGLAFSVLHQRIDGRFAYAFSAGAFAIYHIGIISGWFSFPVFILMVAGLFAAGLVLNFFCHYADSILGSWAIHVAANLAINTIGFMIL